MRSVLARLLAGTLVGAAAIFATAPAAFAHGDPSSHFLEQDVLYPAVGDRPTQDTELRLLGLLYAARDAGYPIKVALVANEQDLTDDLSMLHEPQDYAEFVVAQLGLSRALPVLVITPGGYGLAGAAPAADGRAHLITRPEAARVISSLPPVGRGRGSQCPLSARSAGSPRSRATRSRPSSRRPAHCSRLYRDGADGFSARLATAGWCLRGGDDLRGRCLRGAAPGGRNRRTGDWGCL